jgi:hypothetical protein
MVDSVGTNSKYDQGRIGAMYFFSVRVFDSSRQQEDSRSSILLFFDDAPSFHPSIHHLIRIANNNRNHRRRSPRRGILYTHVGCLPLFVAYLWPSSAQ